MSFEEHETSKLVEEQLTVFGFSVTHMGGTGVVGVLANVEGPIVLARANMDVLRVPAATGLFYTSAVGMRAANIRIYPAQLRGEATAFRNSPVPKLPLGRC